MGVLREWRCGLHGPYESREDHCPWCGHDEFVTQEIRTAPAHHNGRTRAADTILRGIADEHGLSDLKADAKAGVSAAQASRLVKDKEKPYWIDVPHADAGFSGRGEKAATFAPAGFQKTAATGMKLPAPRTQIVGSYKG